VFRPADYTPPWSWLRSLLESRDAAAKVAPGIPHELVPVGVEAEWVSWEGEVKEAALWSGSLATPGVPRRATLLRAGSGVLPESLTTAPLGGAGGGAAPVSGAVVSQPGATAHTLIPTGATPAVGPPGRWLHEPDGAVIRAGLVAEAAELIDGSLLDPTIAYITTDADAESPYTRCWEIEATLPFSLKRLRAALRERGVGRLDVKKRGSAIDPEQLRRDLRLRGDEHAVVVLTRIGGAPSVILCRPPVS
jgi:hypothetical protein